MDRAAQHPAHQALLRSGRADRPAVFDRINHVAPLWYELATGPRTDAASDARHGVPTLRLNPKGS